MIIFSIHEGGRHILFDTNHNGNVMQRRNEIDVTSGVGSFAIIALVLRT